MGHVMAQMRLLAAGPAARAGRGRPRWPVAGFGLALVTFVCVQCIV